MATIATFPDAQGVFIRLVSALRDLYDCSIDTLATSLPKRLGRQSASDTPRLWISPQGIALEPDGLPVSFESFAETLSSEADGKAFTLILSPSLVHERGLSERKLATHMVREMAHFDLAVSTPFDDKNAVILIPRFTVRNHGSRYFIVRKRDLEKVRNALDAVGARVEGVRVSFQAQDLDILAISKLGLPGPRWHRRLWKARLLVLGLCAVTLFLASYGILASKVSSAIADTETALGQLEPEAKAARLKLDTELDRLKTISAVRTRAISEGSVVLTIADLTSLLPDDTFLTDIEIVGSRISLSGYSQASSSLIGVLQDSGLFSNVRFSSSVTKAVGHSGDRFSIVMERAHAG